MQSGGLEIIATVLEAPASEPANIIARIRLPQHCQSRENQLTPSVLGPPSASATARGGPSFEPPREPIFDRSLPYVPPWHRTRETRRSRPPPQAAQCGLDGREHGATLNQIGSYHPRLWENVWDEAADALCFPARQLGCRIDRLTQCGSGRGDQVLIAAISGPT